MKGANEIIVISAYYGTGFIRHLLEVTRKPRAKRKLTLVFAAAPAVARADQIQDLKALKRDIIKRGLCEPNSVDIRLALGKRFLHAKIFQFKAEGELPICVLGSANASNAAFTQNDEVMVAIKPNFNS